MLVEIYLGLQSLNGWLAPRKLLLTASSSSLTSFFWIMEISLRGHISRPRHSLRSINWNIMSPCGWMLLFAMMILYNRTFITPAKAFSVLPHSTMKNPSTSKIHLTKQVEVCRFKDCKRAGGGPPLVKQIGDILTEKGLSDSISLELCDCQVSLKI
jgi:hypothetical protein